MTGTSQNDQRTTQNSQQCTNNVPRRDTCWGISSRLQRDRNAYVITRTRNNSWSKLDVPGGRELWYRMVIGVVAFAVIGIIFVAVGAVLFHHTSTTIKETSLPTVFSIFGIVLGIVMVCLSVVIAKLFISNKWRKNEQPVYPGQRSTSRANGNRVNTNRPSEAHIPMPPAYEESMVTSDLFLVTNVVSASPLQGDTIAPPSYSVLPPSYEESNQEVIKK